MQRGKETAWVGDGVLHRPARARSRRRAGPEGWPHVAKRLGGQTGESGSVWWAVETRCKPLASKEQSRAKFCKVSSGVCVAGEAGGEERTGGAGGAGGPHLTSSHPFSSSTRLSCRSR